MFHVKHRRWILLTVLVIIFMMAGSMDYQAELDEERVYRTNVCDGFWPDYKNLAPLCGGDE